jgi:hypothetical protein
LLGDHHAGEITPTYNPDVYKKRLNEIYQSLLTITELHRHMYPINDLVIVLGGDMVHGENPHQGATVETIACSAYDQIFDIALPELLSFILSLKQEFKTITIHAVKGNHGRYSPVAPRTSNWDMMLYASLRGLLQKHNIQMFISREFATIAEIQGFRFFILHGDAVRAHQGIPFFALDRKIKSWFVTYDGFNYVLCFHWHKDDFFRVTSKTKMIINGSMVSDDPFALEVIGTSSIPSQTTFGVHERRGITWYYPLYDRNYYPDKVEVKGNDVRGEN